MTAAWKSVTDRAGRSRAKVQMRLTSEQRKEEFTGNSRRQTMAQSDSGKGELPIHGNIQEVTE